MRRLARHWGGAAIAAALLLAAAPAQAASLYNIIDLGTLGGASSTGQAINDAGEVARYSRNSDGDNHAFLLTEVAPVPIPAALPLFLSALGGLGFAGWRRRRASV